MGYNVKMMFNIDDHGRNDEYGGTNGGGKVF